MKSVTVPTLALASGEALAPLLGGLPLELRPAIENFIQASFAVHCFAPQMSVTQASWKPLRCRRPQHSSLTAWICWSARVLALRTLGRAEWTLHAWHDSVVKLQARNLNLCGRLAMQVFQDLDMSLLEMNPFTLDQQGSPSRWTCGAPRHPFAAGHSPKGPNYVCQGDAARTAEAAAVHLSSWGVALRTRTTMICCMWVPCVELVKTALEACHTLHLRSQR